jgi:uncharacterized protein YdeI (YjbR/CyaY-like superfamily)
MKKIRDKSKNKELSESKKLSNGIVHEMPNDLRKAIISVPLARESWENISPLARNEWICWIEDAKKSETRYVRIERACNEISQGKRRPCCWAGCSHR